MDSIKNVPTTVKYKPKYVAAILVVTLAVMLGFAACASIPANATEETAAAQPDYEQLYREGLTRIESLERAEAALAGQQAADEAEISSLREQLDAAQQEIARLIDQYGTAYYVEYEVRRTDLLGSEAILRFKTMVSAQTYNATRKGEVLSVVTDHLSIPASSVLTKWTATVVECYPVSVLDQNT